MDKDKLPRPSISLDPELYALAQRRMAERRTTMFSRYIQDLIKEDTADLLHSNKIAEDPPSGSNPVEQKHNSGQDAKVLLDPSVGGSNPAPIKYPRPKRAKSSK